MRFGIDVAQQRMPWDEVVSRVRFAEDLGFDGATEAGRRTLDAALVLLEDLPPSLITVRAFLTRAEELDFAGRYDEVGPWLERAETVLGTLAGSGVSPPRPTDEPLDPAAGRRAADRGRGGALQDRRSDLPRHSDHRHRLHQGFL